MYNMSKIEKRKPIQFGQYKSYIRSKEYTKLRKKLDNVCKNEEVFDLTPVVVNKQ